MTKYQLGYNGNPRLRRAFVKIAMTQDQIDEYDKCLKDPVYFIRHYVKIISLDKGIGQSICGLRSPGTIRLGCRSMSSRVVAGDRGPSVQSWCSRPRRVAARSAASTSQ